ncbi:MAG: efflux RND transporter permease subunit [Myxococcota bacterium]|jgi:multidrug efflux pump subunit AcrB|nr:efflux RND transporter permease subunit [Myxococcota bacterium]
MSRVIAWFVRNPVAANLLMALLVAGGVLALPMIRQEEFPAIETDIVQISVEYPGASPGEIEESVCVRVEEEIDGTPDIKRINTKAVEGACVMFVELVIGANTDASVSEIESRVNALDTLPDDSDPPVISKLITKRQVLEVALSGHVAERELKVIGERARDQIASLPEVSQVNLKYDRPYEISIEVSEDALRRHGLSIGQVADAVRRSSLDLPGGSVKTVGGEILLRTVAQAYEGNEFERIIVMTRNDGTIVRLNEIATIIDGFEETDLRATIDGVPTVVVEVSLIGDEDILDAAAAVREWMADFIPTLPEGVTLQVFNDESIDLTARLNALTRNARSGIILVLLVLTLFLRFRLAMWVAAGVPISLLGAVMLFPTFAISISTLTVMAFILVLGILVDDAIVIGESVHQHEQKGKSQEQAAIEGTQEVFVPVTFGVMTTVAAFLPLILVPGNMGEFFGVIGYAAIICLAFSLIESQLILPGHLAHRRTSSKKGRPNPVVAKWQQLQESMAAGLERVGRSGYGRLLDSAIDWRYASTAAAVGVLLLAMTLFTSGRMRYQFFPPVEGDMVYATLTMPQGVPLERTQIAVKQLEDAAAQVKQEFDEKLPGPSIVKHVMVTIGDKLFRGGPQMPDSQGGGSHLAEVGIELVSAMERETSAGEVERRWREVAGAIPDAIELTFSSIDFSAGKPIEIELRGGTLEDLTQAAAMLRGELATYRGVMDIADTFRAGKQEVKLRLRDEARMLGLTQFDLASQVRQSFYGEEVQRIQREGDDVRVMVRYTEDERHSLGSLDDMRIRTVEGVEVPFSAVADVELSRGFATIERTDLQRAVSVVAEVERSTTTPENVLGDLTPKLDGLLAGYPGVTWRLAGEQEEHHSAMMGLFRGAALALLIIYGLLAIPLNSYTQPFIIMSVIPFGIVGAILGHYIMGWDIVFFSILGMVALSGVVVNSSLVLVHTINRLRGEGLEFMDAVTQAGKRRFRPIVLTSATTYLGLLPLMFEASPPAIPLIPMAISLGYGVLYASIMTLLMVPVGYVILDDWQRLLRGLGSRESDVLDAGEDAEIVPISDEFEIASGQRT